MRVTRTCVGRQNIRTIAFLLRTTPGLRRCHTLLKEAEKQHPSKQGSVVELRVSQLMLCITFTSFHCHSLFWLSSMSASRCSHYRALAWHLLHPGSELLDFSIWEVCWDLLAECLLFTSALERTSANKPMVLAWEIYLDTRLYNTKSWGSHKPQSDSCCFINDFQHPQRSPLLVFTSGRAEVVYIRVNSWRRITRRTRHLSSSTR